MLNAVGNGNGIIWMVFLGVFILALVATVFQLKREKQQEGKDVLLEEKEYQFFCRKSEDAINNTVISFEVDPSDKMPADKYVRTISFGVKKMEEEGFNFKGVDIV